MRRTCKDGVQCTKRYRWGILQVNSCELESKPTRMGRGDLEIGKGGGERRRETGYARSRAP